MKVFQKHVMLAIIFCILLFDDRIGLIFKYFVICDNPVFGDDFILGKHQIPDPARLRPHKRVITKICILASCLAR
jgi:hypothetical protein